MSQSHDDLRDIYLAMISEVNERLRASETFFAAYNAGQGLAFIDAAILQFRKAMEAIALAAIAPCKEKYEVFRARADQPDYTRDYHAGKIFQILGKINKNFYPLPLQPAVRQANGIFHFDRKASGYLTTKRFESLYDRLGKHLHAHNPWSNNKNLQNLVGEITSAIAETRSLLELHAAFVQTEAFSGVWITEVKVGAAPVIIVGQTDGEFIVTDN
ncbi:hypothetical protein EWI61_11770 [Methylolobus aquaticus]|nr:hypothetical protein EWI61_11770 [Methylolobus aquaticus]